MNKHKSMNFGFAFSKNKKKQNKNKKDCGCGAHDPDCDEVEISDSRTGPLEDFYGHGQACLDVGCDDEFFCPMYTQCDSSGVCTRDIDEWTCDPLYFGNNDGCGKSFFKIHFYFNIFFAFAFDIETKNGMSVNI